MRRRPVLLSCVLTAGLLLGLAPGLALAQGEAPEPAVGGGGGPSKVDCRWGEVQKLEPIPGCGVPRHLIIEGGANAAIKLMFSKEDNPTLGRYLFKNRAIGAVAKPFARMMNPLTSDLVLCPSDFQKARVLSFRALKGKKIASRPTCEVGPPPAGGGAAPPPAMTPDADPMGAAPPAPSGDASPPAGKGAEPMSVTAVIEKENPVSQSDLVTLRRAARLDSLARLLGLLGLVLGTLSFAGLLGLALFVRRRLGALEARLGAGRSEPTDPAR